MTFTPYHVIDTHPKGAAVGHSVYYPCFSTPEADDTPLSLLHLDLRTDAWAVVGRGGTGPHPTCQSDTVTESRGPYIYVLGGFWKEDGKHVRQPNSWRYDTETDSWDELSPLSFAGTTPWCNFRCQTVWVGDTLHVFGTLGSPSHVSLSPSGAWKLHPDTPFAVGLAMQAGDWIYMFGLFGSCPLVRYHTGTGLYYRVSEDTVGSHLCHQFLLCQQTGPRSAMVTTAYTNEYDITVRLSHFLCVQHLRSTQTLSGICNLTHTSPMEAAVHVVGQILSSEEPQRLLIPVMLSLCSLGLSRVTHAVHTLLEGSTVSCASTLLDLLDILVSASDRHGIPSHEAEHGRPQASLSQTREVLCMYPQTHSLLAGVIESTLETVVSSLYCCRLYSMELYKLYQGLPNHQSYILSHLQRTVATIEEATGRYLVDARSYQHSSTPIQLLLVAAECPGSPLSDCVLRAFERYQLSAPWLVYMCAKAARMLLTSDPTTPLPHLLGSLTGGLHPLSVLNRVPAPSVPLSDVASVQHLGDDGREASLAHVPPPAIDPSSLLACLCKIAVGLESVTVDNIQTLCECLPGDDLRARYGGGLDLRGVNITALNLHHMLPLLHCCNTLSVTRVLLDHTCPKSIQTIVCQAARAPQGHRVAKSHPLRNLQRLPLLTSAPHLQLEYHERPHNLPSGDIWMSCPMTAAETLVLIDEHWYVCTRVSDCIATDSVLGLTVERLPGAPTIPEASATQRGYPHPYVKCTSDYSHVYILHCPHQSRTTLHVLDTGSREWSASFVPDIIDNKGYNTKIDLNRLPGYLVVTTEQHHTWAYDTEEKEWMRWPDHPWGRSDTRGSVLIGDTLHVFYSTRERDFHHCSLSLSGQWVTESPRHISGDGKVGAAPESTEVIVSEPTGFLSGYSPYSMGHTGQ
ncbi:hypothetical protein KIPB_001161 [Kipferlia bialata]|uniref:Uncharacterized protein n=1 Tax=Kipferlia bialata TaxID=797122 RepID=A0A391NJC5_9EUKA|nr:hypothetical protein KIPB_001161 [Kipferlia bialata]|eukprot:g1161.t1